MAIELTQLVFKADIVLYLICAFEFVNKSYAPNMNPLELKIEIRFF